MPETSHDPVRYDLMVPRLPAEGSVDFRDLFGDPGRAADLELDIGFGKGASLFERANVAPRSCLVGVEVKAKCVYQVEERRARLGLDRVRVFAGDVRTLLPRVVPDGCLARAFVHFPDPWWKKRHRHRRVVDEPLVADLARLLRAGGDFYVQTDVEDRAHQYRDAIAANPAFVLATDTGFIESNPFGARSNRERRAAEDGLPVYRILAHRRGLAAAPLDGRCGG